MIIGVGTVLPNHAKVIAVKSTGTKTIVGCEWRNGSEYVTWVADQKGHTYWGHYHQNKDDMLAEFAARN